MSTLLAEMKAVQPSPAQDLVDGAAWWAAEADGLAPPPAGHTAAAWLAEEAKALSLRAATEADPSGHLGLAADEVKGLLGAFLRGGHDSAGAYLADPDAVPGPCEGGRLVVHLPRPGARRSPLAEGLDVLAAWYLHLDTDAGDLVAWHLEWAAGLADELEADTAAEYFEAEAAWMMAVGEVAGEAGFDVLSLFDSSVFDPSVL